MSDKAQLRAAERYEFNEEKIFAAAIQYMMNSYECRALIFHWLDEFGTDGSPFSLHSNAQTNYQAGMQNAGMTIRNEILEETPDAYILMLKERKEFNERTERNDQQRRNIDDGIAR